MKRKHDSDDEYESDLETTPTVQYFSKEIWGVTFWAGKSGAQNKAIEVGRGLGHEFFVSAELPFQTRDNETKHGRHYTSFPDRETFFEFYESLPVNSPKHYYELLTGVVRLFFDIDLIDTEKPSKQLDDARKTAVLLCLKRTLSLLHVNFTPRINVMRSSRNTTKGYKTSYHLIVTNIGCENVRTAHGAFFDLFQHMSKNEPLMWKNGQPICDPTVYSKNRAFRMALSSKATDLSNTFLSPDVEWSYGPAKDDDVEDVGDYYPIQDAFVQVCSNETLDKLLTYDEIKNVWDELGDVEVLPTMRSMLHQRPAKKCRSCAPSREIVIGADDESSSDLQKKLTKMLRDHGDMTSVVGSQLRDGVWQISNNGGERKCPTGEVHTSNNAFFRIVNNVVYYHCHAASCANNSLLYGVLREEVNQVFTRDGSIFKKIGKYDKYKERRVRPFGDKQQKAELIKSGVRTFKTTTLVELVEKISKKNRIIVITNRISLADYIHQLLKHKGFHHYQADNVNNSTNKVVTQYESLWKFVGENTLDYDYVIIDEITALMPNITTTKLGGTFKCVRNALAFQKLLQSSTKIIGMDADLDDCTIETIGSIVGYENVYFGHNTFAGWPRDMVVYSDKQQWWSTLFNDIKNGVNVQVVCGLREKVANKIKAKCAELKAKCVCITTESTSNEIRQFISDVNQKINVPQVFCFTAKIQNGVSVNIENHFTRTYLYAHWRTSTARELMQMVARVRSIQDSTIHAYVEQPNVKSAVFATTPQTAIEVAVQLQDKRKHEDEILTMFVDGYNKVQFKNMPRWWCVVQIRNILERNLSTVALLAELTKLVRESGGEVSYAKCNDVPEEEVEDDNSKTNRVQEIIKRFDHTLNIQWDQIEILELKQKSGKLTEDERWQLLKYNYEQHFTCTVDGRHYAALEGFKGFKTMNNFIAVSNLSLEKYALNQVVKNLENDVPKELQELNVTWVDTITKVSAILNFKSALDTRTVFNSNILVDNFEAIRDAFEKTSRDAIKPNAQSIRAAISGLYSRLGMKLKRVSKNSQMMKLAYCNLAKKVDPKIQSTADVDYVDGKNVTSEICKLLGLESTFDTITVIPQSRIEDNKDKIGYLLSGSDLVSFKQAKGALNTMFKKFNLYFEKHGAPIRATVDGARDKARFNYILKPIGGSSTGHDGENSVRLLPTAIPEFVECYDRRDEFLKFDSGVDVVYFKDTYCKLE